MVHCRSFPPRPLRSVCALALGIVPPVTFHGSERTTVKTNDTACNLQPSTPSRLAPHPLAPRTSCLIPSRLAPHPLSPRASRHRPLYGRSGAAPLRRASRLIPSRLAPHPLSPRASSPRASRPAPLPPVRAQRCCASSSPRAAAPCTGAALLRPYVAPHL